MKRMMMPITKSRNKMTISHTDQMTKKINKMLKKIKSNKTQIILTKITNNKLNFKTMMIQDT